MDHNHPSQNIDQQTIVVADSLETWRNKLFLLQLMRKTQPTAYEAYTAAAFAINDTHNQNLDSIKQELTAEYQLQSPETAILDSAIGELISVATGDITTIAADAIANSAHESLDVISGLNATIFMHAGVNEMREAISAALQERAQPPQKGDVVITTGCKLPARYVLHAIAPNKGDADAETILQSLYDQIFAEMQLRRWKTIAIPCIGCGEHGRVPIVKATYIALSSLRRWIDANRQYIADGGVSRIVFVCYSAHQAAVYEHMLQYVFGTQI